ncbi:hypothetical protein [Jannaschia seohaensis]|uniref:Sensory transduction regulator n=1 Tax=Jannaschia seohaensis TaxID=475081 RepID=A0A2Y9B2T0_9RHOB|nr:hypothetical protein [Jannaschia seohaensis]PWJ16216.1 hypothetical protein BCF38_109101 [Jannaschia seohaensis]SSA49257.1 hypothetical protein SAMN05421539_109101 [Jannaschia seohaensis]
MPILAVLRAFVLALLFAGTAAAQEVPADMTLDRMEAVLTRLDPATERAGVAFRLTVEDVPLIVITDPRADRMRAMVPIRSAEGLTPEDLRRMMQANFDSALDARYAVAEGRLWAVYIHPLSPLRDDQLISGIGQVVNVALTYGTLYSSGGAQFGRGDSRGEQQKLLERLQEQGRDL